MRCLLMLAAAALVLCGAPAWAQDAPERFQMTPADGGFLRLDKQTGAVSFCTVEGGSAVCRIGADERASLDDEIARLRRENAELKAARGGLPTAPREEDVDRAFSLAERMLRRFLRLFGREPAGERI